MSRLSHMLLVATVVATALACQHEVTMSWMASASRDSSWPPAYANGKIYSVQAGSGVSSIDEVSGTVAWSVEDSDVVGGPALSSGNVIVGKAGNIVALNAADGSVAAQYALGSGDEVPCRDGAPVVSGGKVYFGTSAGKVYALDATTLELAWVTQLGASNAISAPVSLWNEYIVAGTFSGNVFLIAPDGTVSRSYMTPDVPAFEASTGVIYGIQTGIIISGNVAYFGTNTDANLMAINLRSMTSLWSSTLSAGSYSYSTPAISGNTVFTTTHDGRLYGVDATSGSIKLFLDLAERVAVRGPLPIVDGAVVVTTSSGSVAGIHVDTHDMDFWFAFGAAGSPSSAAVSTSGLRLVVSGDQMIYPLDLTCRA